MADDLHVRLHAAITARLEVARAATPGPWQVDGPWWHDGPGGAEQTGLVTAGPLRTAVLLGTPPRPLGGSPKQVEADVAYAALHDPADAILRYEADLAIIAMYHSARSEQRRRVGSVDPAYKKERAGLALDHASAMGRLTALGLVLERLLDVYPEARSASEPQNQPTTEE